MHVDITRRRYLAYGLTIESEIELVAPELRNSIGDPDVLIVRAPSHDRAPTPDGPAVGYLPCYGPCHRGAIVTLVHRGPGGAWFWQEAMGTLHVSPDGRKITHYGDLSADRRILGLHLVGQPLTFVLHQLGYPSLHASAVTTDVGTVVFLGPAHQGKSTMASGFLRRGARLLTDDVLPLTLRDGLVLGNPSLPYMKLWQNTVDGVLELDRSLPDICPGSTKKLLEITESDRLVESAVPIHAVYVLRRTARDEPTNTVLTVRPLARLQALTALLSHASNRAFLRPTEHGRMIELFQRLAKQADIAVLDYPDGFAYQSLVHEEILSRLRDQSERR